MYIILSFQFSMRPLVKEQTEACTEVANLQANFCHCDKGRKRVLIKKQYAHRHCKGGIVSSILPEDLQGCEETLDK